MQYHVRLADTWSFDERTKSSENYQSASDKFLILIKVIKKHYFYTHLLAVCTPQVGHHPASRLYTPGAPHNSLSAGADGRRTPAPRH